MPGQVEEERASRGPRVSGATLLALGLAAGIWIGHEQPWMIVWPWVAAALALVVIAAMARDCVPRAAVWALALAAAGLGAALVIARQHHASRDDLAALVGDEPLLVRASGVALRAPELRSRVAGSLGAFDYRGPATYFTMRVERVALDDAIEQPVRGEVLVRVNGTMAPGMSGFRTGDGVRVSGVLHPMRPPLNPGEFDFQAHARALGQAGVLAVARADLVNVTPRAELSWLDRLARWREALRVRASGWILANLPEARGTERAALLAALLLGQRERELDDVNESFRNVGLAHVLAISGMHLSVLAGFVLLLVRAGGSRRRWHGVLLIALMLGYMLLVELRPPVLRAGIMTIVASLGIALGRRVAVSGLVALSAIPILLARPDQLFDPGFQLTYGVVLGLIHFVPHVRERMFARPKHAPATKRAMLLEWARTAWAVALTAWLIATPLQIVHFGTVSPLGAPLSVLVVPVVSLLLALGYAKMLLSALLPTAAIVLAWPMAIVADAMIAFVRLADALPCSVLNAPPVVAPVAWALAAEACVVAWALHRSRRARRAIIIGALVIVAWLLWPLLPLDRPALRIDMLAVNDGSCYVLRSGGKTVMFDAGSSPDLDAGRKRIIPALRRIGVRSIDAIIVSHANLDHYSSVIELVEEFAPAEVIVTDHLVSASRTDPFGPVAMLVEAIERAACALSSAHAGETRRWGEATFTWLHPRADDVFRHENDSSMVVRVEAAGRRILMCGDIQREAMAMMMTRGIDMRADVIELPHHGSHHEPAEDFIKRVGANVVMQSTGPMRLRADRWAEALVGAERLITARDGACRVEIDRDGTITTTRFLDSHGAARSEGK